MSARKYFWNKNRSENLDVDDQVDQNTDSSETLIKTESFMATTARTSGGIRLCNIDFPHPLRFADGTLLEPIEQWSGIKTGYSANHRTDSPNRDTDFNEIFIELSAYTDFRHVKDLLSVQDRFDYLLVSMKTSCLMVYTIANDNIKQRDISDEFEQLYHSKIRNPVMLTDLEKLNMGFEKEKIIYSPVSFSQLVIPERNRI